jgi:phosphoribosylanthranilate isomerase
MLFIKICGVTRVVDAKFAVANSVDAVGFISYPKSPRAVSPETVRKILLSLPVNDRSFQKVGVFVNARIDEIRAYLNVGIDTIQLHGDESAEFAEQCATLHLPGSTRQPEIWKVISPVDKNDILRFKDFPADKFLLDTFKKGMRGGTGVVMDLKLAKFAVETLRKPVILAGGISPANFTEIVSKVTPYGIDVNSGVESHPGVKDHALMRRILSV